jgi:hypothetical protein
LSEGKLTVLYVKRNEKTGEFEAVKKEVVGTPVLITTTTAVSIDEDMENRTFYVSIDTSDEQTRRIIEYEKKRASDPNFIALLKEKKEKAKLIKLFFKTLQKYPVYIPEELLDDLSGELPLTIRARRDFNKLISTIMAVAVLHQHDREKIEINGEKYIVATKEDVDFVKKWFLHDLKLQTIDVKPAYIKLYECVMNQIEKKGTSVFHYSDKDIVNCMNLSTKQIKEYLRAWR